MSSGQVVDTPTAAEFMAEILERVSEPELAALSGRLEAKSAAFAALLGAGRAATISDADLRRVLRSVFSSRRKADAILATATPDALRAAITRLLAADEPLSDRFTALDDVLGDFPQVAFDLPGELLHFTDPDRYWLWTRWMWDPTPETGALRLVTMEEFDLDAPTRGEAYLRVGEAVAFVNETGKAVGFTSMGTGLFGIDVFLGCVYAVYMYTVLRLRMTQEFNKVVPQLPELVGRLLGIHRMEV